MDNTDKRNINVPENSQLFITNIYLIYSPLHYLAAESVAVNFEQDAHNFLFYLKSEFKDMVDLEKWNSADFLPWPRFYPDKGLLGRLHRTRKNLAMVAGACKGAHEIRLHTPVIDTEAVNYFINHIRTTYPDAMFCVRLIPDGLLNIQRHPLSRFKEILQYCKKARRLICPDLNYYTFRGDRTGSDAKIVDRIYVMPGFPHKYDSAKTVELPSLCRAVCPAENKSQIPSRKRALVLGQPLTAFKRFTFENLQSVTSGIRAFIDTCGIDDIEYKSHPRDPDRELSHLDYRELAIDQPLEAYLADNTFDLIIGVYSTALLTARLILPKSCRVVAYGTDLVKYRGDQEKANILSTFVSLDVEIVLHRS